MFSVLVIIGCGLGPLVRLVMKNVVVSREKSDWARDSFTPFVYAVEKNPKIREELVELVDY
ncbi:MAG: hypothetical protein GY820_03505 [Gammaproteobacteria bacterium]|nr:hypothetical protein [Gammaproteobacteria bacterium]